jgi:hypothetical protein
MNIQKRIAMLLIVAIICLIYMGTNWTQSSQCGRYPQKSDILIDNVNWQVLQIPIGFVYILNAYMDKRLKSTSTLQLHSTSQQLSFSVNYGLKMARWILW